jgi:hypothetical protein
MYYIILGFIGYLLFDRLNNRLQQLTVRFVRFVPDVANLKLRVVVEVFNPLPVSVTVSNFIGVIKNTRGDTLADVFSIEETVIGPGVTNLTLQVSPYLGNLTGNWFRNLSGTFDGATLIYTVNSGMLSYRSQIPIQLPE